MAVTKHRPFRFGGGMIPAASRAEWVDHAKKVEDLGYSTLCQGQHVAWGGIEPMVALVVAADATSALRVASHVFTNDLHNPVLLWQAATTLDVFSDGRLEFGLGAGWLRSDYETCGVPFEPPSARIARLEEAVRVIKGLWNHEITQFTGDYYRVTAPAWPLEPSQRPHPPIFLGGDGRRMLTLAAREADIVGLGADPARATPEETDRRVGWIREAAGGRYQELEIQIGVQAIEITDNRRRAAEEIVERFATATSHLGIAAAPLTPDYVLASPRFLVGAVEQIVEELHARRERYGVSYITVHGDAVDAFSPVVANLAGR